MKLENIINKISNYLTEAQGDYSSDFKQTTREIKVVDRMILDLSKKTQDYEVSDEDLGQIRKIKTLIKRFREEADKLLSIKEAE